MEIRFVQAMFAGLLAMASIAIAHAAQVVGVNNSQCMTLPEHGGYVSDGTDVRVIECRGQSNQQWTVSSGQISGYAGKCLDVQGSIANDGAPVIAVTCNGGPSQRWSLANGRIIGIGGKCLDVSSATAFRAPLIISACSSAPSQQWSVN